jgi:DNA-binding CsgD family transcriptional regulator
MRRLAVTLLLLPGSFGLSMWTGVGPADDWVHTCEVRQSYLDRLEAMEVEVNRMRIQGRSEQEIARVMVPKRNQARSLVRAKMKLKDIRRQEQRDQARYGSPHGPTIEWMYARHGGNWHEIVEASLDSNGFYDVSCIPWYDL